MGRTVYRSVHNTATMDAALLLTNANVNQDLVELHAQNHVHPENGATIVETNAHA